MTEPLIYGVPGIVDHDVDRGVLTVWTDGDRDVRDALLFIIGALRGWDVVLVPASLWARIDA